MHLTPEQLKALLHYQQMYGRYWKDHLRANWEGGDYSYGVNSSALQQLRNTLGPVWLIAYRPGDHSVGWLRRTTVTRSRTVKALRTPGNTWQASEWHVVDEAGFDAVTPGRTKNGTKALAQAAGMTVLNDPTDEALL